MLPTLLCGSLLAFTPLAPLRAPVRTRTSAVKCVAPLDTAMLQLAEEGGGINPVFLLLGALPLVAGGALFLISADEKKTAERRADPANADRLGYTQEEVDKFDEMKRLRWEADVKLYQADKAKAAELGVPVEQVTAERTGSSSKSKSYFDKDDTEVAGSTRF